MLLRSILVTTTLLTSVASLAAESIKIGIASPTTGRYKEQGQSQVRGALLAVEEINAAGGVLGRPLELLIANTASKAERAASAIDELAGQGAVFTFGATSSEAALEAGRQAAKHNLLFTAVQGYANNLTGEDGQRHFFRETYNARMAARALATYLNDQLQGKKLFYMTADYQWGWSVEESLRQFTATTDSQQHPAVRVHYPRPRRPDFEQALQQAQASGADVLVLIQFGEDMATALELATRMGLKERMTIIVPTLTLGMAVSAGAEPMENVIGTVPWYWKVPQQYGYEKGQAFVRDYSERYGSFPSSAAASAYSTVHQFRDAADRSRSLKTDALIRALEGHRYSLLKDDQNWRALDHQNVQSVYVVKGRQRDEVIASPQHADYFDILLQLPAEDSAISADDWQALRKAAGKSGRLN